MADPRRLDRSAQAAVRAVLAAAVEPGNRHEVRELGPVSSWLLEQARQAALDIVGYRHAIDTSAVRHIRKEHADVAREQARGQLAIVDADLMAIPVLLAAPDHVVFGTASKLGRRQIAYLGRTPGGSALLLEEVRDRRRHLAALSMRKYPPAMNVASILATLDPNARSNREDRLKIIDVPESVKAVAPHRPVR